MMAEPTNNSRIQVFVSGSVARIQFHHPPLNIIDIAMMDELAVALLELESRDDVTVVIFSGSEKAFSAGVDIPAHLPETIDEMLRKFHQVIRALVGSRKLTIAEVRGACLGGGAELAMVCDLVYTARDASWAFPEIKLACYPPVAAVGLSALVGQKRAAELILTGRQISGDEAAAIGLATGSARSEELFALVEDVVDRVRQLSPAALRVAKKAYYAWDAIHFDKGLAKAEDIYRNELMKTEDAREGVRAFIEKRVPRWSGK
jgi:cyclohexa-1,5-dienecarbonyl-CoA hydratase